MIFSITGKEDALRNIKEILEKNWALAWNDCRAWANSVDCEEERITRKTLDNFCDLCGLTWDEEEEARDKYLEDYRPVVHRENLKCYNCFHEDAITEVSHPFTYKCKYCDNPTP